MKVSSLSALIVRLLGLTLALYAIFLFLQSSISGFYALAEGRSLNFNFFSIILLWIAVFLIKASKKIGHILAAGIED